MTRSLRDRALPPFAFPYLWVYQARLSPKNADLAEQSQRQQAEQAVASGPGARSSLTKSWTVEAGGMHAMASDCDDRADGGTC